MKLKIDYSPQRARRKAYHIKEKLFFSVGREVNQLKLSLN